MNRSILIVICDFLLVSLLVFSTVDINDAVKEGRTKPITSTVATNQVDASSDLSAVMRTALEEEKKQRDVLMGELSRSRETVGEREKQLQTFQQQLQTAEQQRANLQQQYSAAQTNLQSLTEQARASTTDATISKEKLAAMEAELRKRAEEAVALQQQLAQLSQSNQATLTEKQRLAGQLQLAEVEKRYAAERTAALTEQVKVEREEKAKLVEGVKTLATNSTQLAQELRENRPLAPNAIFDEFMANRVRADFAARRLGLFDTNKRKEAVTVLVSDGTNIFALCHVEDTPLTLWNPGAQWDGLAGTLARGAAQVPVRALSFHLQDPRVVFMPVSTNEARQLGGKIYRVSATPYRFQDAVLVGGTGEGYYGECKFEIDPSAPTYVKLDRSVVKGLFGKFNPSRGDLVFSKSGDLLGIMANNTYCLLIHNFPASATINFGPDVRAQNTGNTLASLYYVVQQMPFKLQ